MTNKTHKPVKDKLIYGYTKPVHKLAELYFSRDILRCDAMLINDLLSHYPLNDDMGLAFNYDNIENLMDNSPDAIEEFLINYTEDDSWQNLPSNEKATLAQQSGFEPEYHEIYEWWSITIWLADQLKSCGQPVLQNQYGQWWGRTSTGQSIILDSTIQQIAILYA